MGAPIWVLWGVLAGAIEPARTGCDHDGTRYDLGATFARDDRTTCTCTEDGPRCVEQAQVEIRDVLTFRPGARRLTRAHQERVDAVAQVLGERPELRLAIVAGGLPAELPELAWRRAEAVRLALVARGVATERLEVVVAIGTVRAPEVRFRVADGA